MAKLLMNLRNVPDDEADDVRRLLREHAVDFYETQPGLFGISAGGIWLREASERARARSLLDDYQRRRGDAARALHARERAEGRAETFASLLRARPLFVVTTLLAMVLAAALVLLPFVLLRG